MIEASRIESARSPDAGATAGASPGSDASARHQGVEIVVTKENINELPAIIKWAAQKQIDYILVTHLLIFDEAGVRQSLFNPNAQSTIDLYQSFKSRAEQHGIDLQRSYADHLKFAGTRTPKQEQELLLELLELSRAGDHRLNLSSLIDHDNLEEAETLKYISEALDIAKSFNIELFIPPFQAADQRSCRFMEERAVFIDTLGHVMPCHFLWHSYSCRVLGEQVSVEKRSFGNIEFNSLETIWNSSNYEAFRAEAQQVEYSPCWSCTNGPCSNIIGDEGYRADDCYGSGVPCGHCQWNLGGIRCM